MAEEIHGAVISVTDRNMGDEFAVAASSTATTLFLTDVSDFAEEGGWVLINGVSYAYDVVDMDADTIHLTAGLAGSAAVGDRVDIWDADNGVVVSERYALVATDDQDDGDNINAAVDHSLAPLLPQTTLATGQSVSLIKDGAAHRVVAVHGKNSGGIQRSTQAAYQMGIDDNAGNVFGIIVTPGGSVVRAATGGDFRVKSADGTTFLPALASAFTVSSDPALKTPPTEAPDALTIIADAPSQAWRYKTDDDDVQRIGPMATDLPEWLQQADPEDGTLGVDLARMVGVLWKACSQLATRVDELEKGRP